MVANILPSLVIRPFKTAATRARADCEVHVTPCQRFIIATRRHARNESLREPQCTVAVISQ